MNRCKILAIPATSRQSIAKQEVVKQLNSMNGIEAAVQIFDSLADLPLHSAHTGDPAEPITNFCQAARFAEVIVIYLPEFTFGVPGALNNALEWALPFEVFSDKFVALVTTSQTKNRVMQRFINEISARLYPVCTLRTYYLPHNLGPENQTAELQCRKTMQTMLAEAKHYANKRKLSAVA